MDHQPHLQATLIEAGNLAAAYGDEDAVQSNHSRLRPRTTSVVSWGCLGWIVGLTVGSVNQTVGTRTQKLGDVMSFLMGSYDIQSSIHTRQNGRHKQDDFWGIPIPRTVVRLVFWSNIATLAILLVLHVTQLLRNLSDPDWRQSLRDRSLLFEDAVSVMMVSASFLIPLALLLGIVGIAQTDSQLEEAQLQVMKDWASFERFRKCRVATAFALGLTSCGCVLYAFWAMVYMHESQFLLEYFKNPDRVYGHVMAYYACKCNLLACPSAPLWQASYYYFWGINCTVAFVLFVGLQGLLLNYKTCQAAISSVVSHFEKMTEVATPELGPAPRELLNDFNDVTAAAIAPLGNQDAAMTPKQKAVSRECASDGDEMTTAATPPSGDKATMQPEQGKVSRKCAREFNRGVCKIYDLHSDLTKCWAGCTGCAWVISLIIEVSMVVVGIIGLMVIHFRTPRNQEEELSSFIAIGLLTLGGIPCLLTVFLLSKLTALCGSKHSLDSIAAAVEKYTMVWFRNHSQDSSWMCELLSFQTWLRNQRMGVVLLGCLFVDVSFFSTLAVRALVTAPSVYFFLTTFLEHESAQRVSSGT